jgi:phosphate transport system substrate-binding protein
MRGIKRLVSAAVISVAAITAVAAPVMADPINPHTGKGVTPAETDVVGVGSDTIEYLLDQLSYDYNRSHAKHNATHPYLYSWDATNPLNGKVGQLTKIKAGCSKIARPDGSSAGITALSANQKTRDGKHFCIDYARSSRARASTDPAKAKGGIEFVALARDAVAYATQKTSNAPTNLTTAQLAAIYNCTDTTWTQVGGTSSATIQPFLPQTGSGTRSFFLAAIGVATPGSCVNSSVQENEGTNSLLVGNANAIVPYSIAKYIAQVDHSAKCGKKPTSKQNKFGCDEHGTMKLNSINGTKPTVGSGAGTTINPKFTAVFTRTVYDVVRYAPKTKDHIPGYLEPFFAAKNAKVKGWACGTKAGQADVRNYGFLATSLCGIGF